jgi:hypothetical protein
MDAQLKATWDLRFAEIVYEDDTQIVLAYPRHDLPLHAENRPRWSSARWRYELIFLESKGIQRPGKQVEYRLHLTGSVLADPATFAAIHEYLQKRGP